MTQATSGHHIPPGAGSLEDSQAAGRLSSAAGAAGATMNSGKRTCGPGLLQRLVRRLGYPSASAHSTLSTGMTSMPECANSTSRAGTQQ